MNKVISQFKAYLTALLLVGGFMMLADCAQAQSNLQPQSTNGVKIPVTGAWADANQAVSLLGTAIQNAETVLNSGGSVNLEYSKYKLYFLQLIQDAISKGVPVNKAVQVSFDVVSGEVQPDSGISSVTANDLQVMFKEVVDLLTN